MVAYAMRITDLDPLVHGLIFERFLNPDRVSMPDFDIDFDERRRGEVIRYVTEKYGDDRVSMIVTYGTIKAKQAVKDSSRILGYPFAMGDRITKAMPAAVMGKDVPLKEIFDPEHKRYGEGGEFRVALRRRQRRQAGRRHRDRHRGPQAPVGRARRRRDHVQRAAARRHPDDQAARRRRDDHPVRLPDLREPRPDQDGLPGAAQPHGPRRRGQEHRGQPRRGRSSSRSSSSTDEATYELLQRGDTLGVFQLDGGPMRALLRSMRPDTLRGHLRGRRALPAGPDGRRLPQQVRPPQDRPRAGRGRSTPSSPSRSRTILGETYGLIVYQEQVMAIAQKLAGYTPRPGRPAAPGDGQEEEGGAGQAVRAASPPA